MINYHHLRRVTDQRHGPGDHAQKSGASASPKLNSGRGGIPDRMMSHKEHTVDDVRASHNAALSHACKNGYLEEAQSLVASFGLTAGDVRADDNHALRVAREDGHLLVAQRPVASFGLTADETHTGNNYALSHACAAGHLEVAQWLVASFGLTANDVRANRRRPG
jgi:hypothetical protein